MKVLRPDLVYEPSVGAWPAAGTLEADLLSACSREDRELWRKLCRVPFEDIEGAVQNLCRLGWRFRWVTLQ